MRFAFFQSGQHKLDRLYETYQRDIRAFAYHLTQAHPDLAEDVVQDALLRMARYLHALERLEEPAVHAYVMQCVKSAAMDLLRREGFLKTEPLEDYADRLTDGTLILDQICDAENYQLLVQQIVEMPEKYADVLFLYYLDDMELREIAGLLGISHQTAQKRFTRGRKMLQDKLIEGGFYHAGKK